MVYFAIHPVQVIRRVEMGESLPQQVCRWGSVPNDKEVNSSEYQQQQ